MPAINRIYIGNRPVKSIFIGEQLVNLGVGSNADSGELLLADLPAIANPIDSIVPKITQSNFKTSSSSIALLGSLGVSSIEIPCSGLPTKKDIVDQFNKIAQLPAKLKQQLIEGAGELEQKVVDEIESLIKDIEDLVEKLADVLSPYWEKGKIRNWQKEAKDAWDELIQEYHIFIPVKMLEMISKLIPVDFNVNILGIDINVLKIFTAEEQLRIKTQIAEKIPSLPEPFDDLYNGKFGVKCDEWRAKYTWQYIKNEIIQWCTNALHKAFGALIKKFKKIWKKLGLPALPDLLDFDVESYLKSKLESLKDKARDKIVEELERVQIFGKSLLDIIGGKIDENIICAEELIADLMRQAKEWFAQWQKELLNQWIRKIKKFLDKIGLGKLLDILALDFCDVLKLIGIPTTFTLSV